MEVKMRKYTITDIWSFAITHWSSNYFVISILFKKKRKNIQAMLSWWLWDVTYLFKAVKVLKHQGQTLSEETKFMNQVDDVIVRAWRESSWQNSPEGLLKFSLAAKYGKPNVALLISVTEVITEWNISMFYGYCGLDNWRNTYWTHKSIGINVLVV